MKSSYSKAGIVLMMTLSAIFLPLSAIAGGTPKTGAPLALEDVEADTVTICTDPRPQICTQDYTPVCAVNKEGAVKVYSNGCSACADPEVVEFKSGECTPR